MIQDDTNLSVHPMTWLKVQKRNTRCFQLVVLNMSCGKLEVRIEELPLATKEKRHSFLSGLKGKVRQTNLNEGSIILQYIEPYPQKGETEIMQYSSLDSNSQHKQNIETSNKEHRLKPTFSSRKRVLLSNMRILQMKFLHVNSDT